MKTSSTSRIDGSAFVTKWSIKPADYKATRVRDNQRRHREKVKNYIAELESQLSKTQAELQEARFKIEHLTGQLKSVQSLTVGRCNDTTPQENDRAGNQGIQNDQRLPPSTQRREVSTNKSTSSHLSTTQLLPESELSSAHHSSVRETADSAEHSARMQKHSQALAKGHQFGHSRIANKHSQLSSDDGTEVREEDYRHLQPPGPTESTTRCRDAYKIIAQQNFAQLELSTVHVWLEPGFRGPLVEDDGCRVENQLLFALLDYVNSL